MKACAMPEAACVRDNKIQTCSIGSDGCAVTASTSCGGALVCQRQGGPSCIDPDWAAWPVSNTPTDVMAGAPNPSALVDNGNDTVTDKVTGLMWERSPPTFAYALSAAVTQCKANRRGGFDDWRIPTAIELHSLVDHGRFDPAIDPTVFPGTPSVSFLTTTTAGSPSALWLVDFKTGMLTPITPSTTSGATIGNLRCVR